MRSGSPAQDGSGWPSAQRPNSDEATSSPVRYGSGPGSDPHDGPGGRREMPFGPEISWPNGFRQIVYLDSRRLLESGDGPASHGADNYGSGATAPGATRCPAPSAPARAWGVRSRRPPATAAPRDTATDPATGSLRWTTTATGIRAIPILPTKARGKRARRLHAAGRQPGKQGSGCRDARRWLGLAATPALAYRVPELSVSRLRPPGAAERRGGHLPDHRRPGGAARHRPAARRGSLGRRGPRLRA